MGNAAKENVDVGRPETGPPPTVCDEIPNGVLRLYSLTAARVLLGDVSERHVYQLIYDGVLRKAKQGRRTFVRSDDIAAYIEAATTPAEN
jgi:hypothetical protein